MAELKKKKSIFKQGWFWGLVLIGLIAIGSAGLTSPDAKGSIPSKNPANTTEKTSENKSEPAYPEKKEEKSGAKD
ncbi:hypothetical protein [Peribacillus sp. SCS-155]|uniref:hypothetical protein n=1 Tax=Peribacillus sedimenti TaxID=3115297 RepID=UPI00390594AE